MGYRSDFPPQPREFFQTPRDFALALLGLPNLPPGPWFDPSAGGGGTMLPFMDAGIDVTGIDLEPLHENIAKADFLDLDSLPAGTAAVVTNPPWSLAARFIDHAFKIAPPVPVIFLLPGDWLHAQGRARFVERCTAIGAVNRKPQWIGGTPDTAKAYVSWFRFDLKATESRPRFVQLSAGKSSKYTGKRCRRCTWPIPPNKRADTQFCTDRCRVAAHRAKELTA